MKKKKKNTAHDWISSWILDWREILREIKKSHSFIDIFFDQERFMRLFDSRILGILFSKNSQGSGSNRYLTKTGLITRDSRIKNVVKRVHGVVKNVVRGVMLLVLGVCLCRLQNRNIVERKNIYLRGFLPIPMNSVGSREESSNINRFVISLLYPPKGSSNQSIHHFDSIRNEDVERTEIESGRFPKFLFGSSSKFRLSAEGEKRMNNNLLPEEIEEFLGNPTRSIHSFFSDRWSELYLGSSPTERSPVEKALWKRKLGVSFVPFRRRSEHKELVDLFKIIRYLQKTVSIHPISPGYSMIPKEKSNAEDRFAEMVNRFILSITEPNKDSIGKDSMNHRTRTKSTINQHLSNWAKSEKKWFDPFICRTQRSRNGYPDAYSKWSNEFQNLQEDFLGYFSSKQEKLQVVFDQLRDLRDQLRCHITDFSSYWDLIDWSEIFDIYEFTFTKLFLVLLPMARLFFHKLLKLLIFFPKFLYWLYPRFSVHIGNIAIHSSEMYIYELKDPIQEKSFEPLRLQIVLLKKLKPFLLNDHNTSQRLDDHNTSQGSKLWINEERIFPFYFNEISKWMIDSSHSRKNRMKSFDNTDSYFSIIPHDRDNWLNPVKAFHRSSMISSFYKANGLRFWNDLHHFWFWVSCKKRFPFFVEKIRINNEDLTYRKFLNISFIRNKIVSLYVGQKKHFVLSLSARVSDINIPQDQDFPKSSDKRENLYKSFMYKLYQKFYNRFYTSFIFPRTLYAIQSDPVVFRASSSIADLLRPIQSDPVVSRASSSIADLFRLEKTFWQSFSDMNRSDSKMKNLHQYLSVNSNMDCGSNPCSEKSLPSGKKEKRSLFGFRSKKKYVKKRNIKIINKKKLFSVKLFEGNIEENIIYLEWTIYKEWLLTIFTTSGFKYFRFILSEIFSYFIFPTVISKIQDILDIPWVYLEKILMKWTLISEKILMKWTLISKKISNLHLVQLLRKKTNLSRTKTDSFNGSSPFLSCTFSLFFSYRNKSLISAEFLFSILFLLLFAGYLACRGLTFICKTCRQLFLDFEKIKSWANPSCFMELEKLRDRYPISSFRSENLEDPFPVIFQDPIGFIENPRPVIAILQKYYVILEEYIGEFFNFLIELGYLLLFQEESENRNRIDLLISYLTYRISSFISLIPNNFINQIIFFINTRHLSPTSIEMYSLIRKRKKVGNWDDEIESWVADTDWVDDQEKEFVVQLCTLSTEKRINEILWSLTQSNLLDEIVEQPGSNYLRYLFEMQQKDLLNYEFNKSCLAERRIFLAYYETITSWGTFHLSSRPTPFSLRLAPYPSRSVLVIGSIGIGRSYLVKSLAKNSYLPFIKIYPLEYRYLYDYDCDFYEASFWSFLDGESYWVGGEFDDCEDEGITSIPFDVDDFDVDDSGDIAKNINFDKILFNMTQDRLTSNNPFYWDMTVQFDLAKTISPCIVWIPNIHDLDRDELRYLSLHLEESSLSNSKDRQRCFTRNILVIASTHIPREVDPALIGLNKFNTFIKIRRLTIPEQRRYFRILSYTRGFGLENQIFDSKKFGSITMSSNAQHLVALNNEVLSISITQRKYIIEETNSIRFASFRQTWDFQTHIRWFQDHRIFLYQIGRVFAQNIFLSNFPIDPIYIYMQDPIARNKIWSSYLYKWYVELETNLKKITILLYLLSCSAGLVTQDLWSSPGPDVKNWITSSEFLENDSQLVQNLLELEGFLVGCSWIEKNSSETLLLRSEPKNPLDMMQQNSFSTRYRSRLRNEIEINESEFEEEHEAVNPQKIENDFFNENQIEIDIVRSPRIFRYIFDNLEIENIKKLIKSGLPYWAESFQGNWPFYLEEDQLQEEELQENDSEFSENETIQHQKQDRFSKEQSFFIINRFIWEPSEPFFLVVIYLYFWLSPREFFSDDHLDEKSPDLNKHPSSYIEEDSWFHKGEKYYELLGRRQRWQRRLRINSSLSKGSFSSHILFESYQYLANLFLSNERLLDQMTKILLRKRWLLPEEMNHLICGTGERFPIPYP